MNAVDTNVLIYRLDRREPEKQEKARQLLQRLSVDPTPTVLLWQVMGELMRQLRSWQDQGAIKRDGVLKYVATFRRLFPLVVPTPEVIDHALEITDRLSVSHWDSMLLGACKTAGVTTLYTEDMGAPTTLAGVRLVNPFA